MYLRARYYSAAMGRFTSADPAQVENNQYVYAMGNPVNRIDPSGLVSFGLTGHEAFSLCFDIHTGSKGILAAKYLDISFISAQLAVDICKAAYSRGAWFPFKWSFNLEGGHPTTAHELFGRYVFETGDTTLFFDATQPLTEELAVSSLIQRVREMYYHPIGQTTENVYRGGETQQPTEYRFKAVEYAATLLLDSRNSWDKPSLPISQFIGSFWFQVKTTKEGRVGFRIDNDTTLESGTHIGGRFDTYFGSVEEHIVGNPLLANLPVWSVITFSSKLSILRPLTRGDTRGFRGGGNLVQTFVWSERRDESCQSYMYKMNDPSFLDLAVWRDYWRYTVDPLEQLPR